MNAAERSAKYEEELFQALMPLLASASQRDVLEHAERCDAFCRRYKVTSGRFAQLCNQWEQIIGGNDEYDPAVIY